MAHDSYQDAAALGRRRVHKGSGGSHLEAGGGREVRRGSARGRAVAVSTYQEREREALHHDEQLGGREEGGEGWLQGQGVQDQVKEINQGGAEGSSSTETGRGCTRASAAGGGGGGSGGRRPGSASVAVPGTEEKEL